jgi:meso-butanediol dehydrogenase / (S,S)-butanediol dehydrogenase / diacetyl reductase
LDSDRDGHGIRKTHMPNLSGKVALVTGAGGRLGIGRGIAMRLAQQGADVVVNDVRSGGASNGEWGGMEQVVADIRALGRRSIGIVADIGDAQSVQAMVKQAAQEFGRIDILINNAGATAGKDRVPVIELQEGEWDRVQRINSKGSFLCSQAVARLMLSTRVKGRIINIASTAGKTGRATYAAYCASKFAVIGLTQSLAQELAPEGITVNAVCPSLIATERIEDLAKAATKPGSSIEDQRAAIVARASVLSPTGRMATVDDVTGVVVFLASDEASYLTGLAINVAGGVVMH